MFLRSEANSVDSAIVLCSIGTAYVANSNLPVSTCVRQGAGLPGLA